MEPRKPCKPFLKRGDVNVKSSFLHDGASKKEKSSQTKKTVWRCSGS